MKTMSIYEPAMCCETGICGVSVDPELIRISSSLNTLKGQGIEIKRYNLSSAPQAFVDNKVVNEYINSKGVDGLPVVLMDNEIIMTSKYPSNEELEQYFGLVAGTISGMVAVTDSPCCDGSEGCC